MVFGSTMAVSLAVDQSRSTVIAFDRDGFISTETVAAKVESLKVGDLVWTKTRGLQPILAIGRLTYNASRLQANPSLLPIRIPAHALGKNLPERDLFLASEQSVIVPAGAMGRSFESDEVLIAAKHLIGVANIDYAFDLQEVSYYRLLVEGEVTFVDVAVVNL